VEVLEHAVTSGDDDDCQLAVVILSVSMLVLAEEDRIQTWGRSCPAALHHFHYSRKLSIAWRLIGMRMMEVLALQ
jgi:hypothetical protein